MSKMMDHVKQEVWQHLIQGIMYTLKTYDQLSIDEYTEQTIVSYATNLVKELQDLSEQEIRAVLLSSAMLNFAKYLGELKDEEDL